MNFQFATAQQIIFGPGTLKQIGALAAPFGKRALVVIGQNTSRAARLIALLQSAQIESEIFSVVGEPTIEIAQWGAADARGFDCVIALGGGAAIDAGKAIAALATNDGDVFDYLEVIGKGQPLQRAPLPFIAIPTTAGTGAEVTRNAVLHSPEHKVKVSLRSALMLPKVALVDPELAYDLPPEITASTGMDALTQLIEPFVSCRANPLTDALCRDGISRVARSLRAAYINENGAREDMALASLFGGLALANAALGAVHGFAAPIGGMFNAPHGALCAALLAPVMEVNLCALRERELHNPALTRYDEIAQILTGENNAPAGIEWIKSLCADLKIQPLRAFGISQSDFSSIAEKAAAASSMKANPIVLTQDELRAILEAAL
jgi:alcohol dehydrogenase class IV